MTKASHAGAAGLRAGDHLRQGRLHERSGQVAEAGAAFEAARRLAERHGEAAVLAQALRHLGIQAHHRGERSEALALCERSLAIAESSSEPTLAGQALVALANIAFESGEIANARAIYGRALELGGGDPSLRARVEQNLGILANIQGNIDAAYGHYGRSLEAYRETGDERGCALAYHNLGMLAADGERWDEASRCFAAALAIAERINDLHLQGLCLLNRSEVQVAQQRFEAAREDVERALGIFDRLDARLDKADAYRMLGTVFREIGRPEVAESRLRDARALAASHGSVLSEAEACRELARLYRETGRNQDALSALNAAYRLFRRLDARTDLVDVGGRIADLESTYLKVVHEWGQSLESSDSYTHGHCERVAAYAVAVGGALGFDAEALTTLRLGAYLHDIGKVRVPHEILNKPGKLTPEEFETIQMHPVWGLELLEGVDFPWDIRPIIRWHHEKYDGTGYPDRLAGEAIPLAAQVICIVDVYDALTTARSYKAALGTREALDRLAQVRHWWRPDVYDAFMATVGRTASAEAAAA